MSGVGSSTAGFDDLMTRLGISKSATTTETRANDTLDQSAFLKLMTAQLQNQDPFKPVDNAEMVAQMAQFSNVAGISEMNSSLKDISTRLNASSASEAIGYVGKTVLVDGNVAYPNSEGGLTAYAELDSAANDLSVTITDVNGNVVRQMSMGPQAAGRAAIDWDGKTDAGADAGDGPFKITANAVRSSGSTAATTLVWAPVTSVTLPAGTSPATLQVAGLGEKQLSSVRQVG